MEPILLKASDVAPLLGISRSKVYELIASGEIPSLTLGNSLRVPLAELRAWASKRMANVSAASVGDARTVRE